MLKILVRLSFWMRARIVVATTKTTANIIDDNDDNDDNDDDDDDDNYPISYWINFLDTAHNNKQMMVRYLGHPVFRVLAFFKYIYFFNAITCSHEMNTDATDEKLCDDDKRIG